MHAFTLSLVAGVLFASSIGAQAPAERLLRFTQTGTSLQFQEIATVVRSIAEIRDAFVDSSAKTLRLRGTAEQMEMADWLFSELDKQPHPEQKGTRREHRIAGDSSENVIRVFYFRHAETVQQLQELSTTVRSLTEMRRAFTYNAPRAMIARATPDQIAMADWLIAKLDRPAGDSIAHSETYTVPNSTNDRMRVFYLKHTDTVQQHQEISTVVRSIAEIRRAFTYNTPRVLALRGTAEQLAMAEWTIDKLDRPAFEETLSQQISNAAAYQYRVAGSEDDVLRVFYLPQAVPVEALQQTAVEVRRTAAIMRGFTYNSLRALALRGRADQIATAEQILRDRATP